MIAKILFSILIPAVIVVAWVVIWCTLDDVFNGIGDPAFWLLAMVFLLLLFLWIFVPAFWFWISVVTMTFLLVGCLKHPIWFVGALSFLCLAVVYWLVIPRFKPGSQWVESNDGTMVWIDCPSATTNVVWSGQTQDGTASGFGNLTVYFEDGSIQQTNLVLRWGFPETFIPIPLKKNKWQFFGKVKKGTPRGFGILCNGNRTIVGTFRSNGSAKGVVREYDFGGQVVYEGGFRRYKYNGKGLLRQNEIIYNGMFKDGLYHGFGSECFPDGRRFEGTYKDGLRHGYGREWFPDGSRFKGYFKNGVRHGRGASTSFGGYRSWHVWKKGNVADREMELRHRLDTIKDHLSTKTHERFERYLCYYELNRWWMTSLAILFFFGYLYGSFWIWKYIRPKTPVVDEKMSNASVIWLLLLGACIGLHRGRTGNRWWFLFPVLFVLAVVFSTKTFLLFVPFPTVYLAMPTIPIETIIVLLIYAVLCLYDLLFGVYYSVYLFNWQYFRTSSVDEILMNGRGDFFLLPNQGRECLQTIEEQTIEDNKCLDDISKRLKEKHGKEKVRIFFPRTRARISEWWTGNEKSLTREMVNVFQRLHTNHVDLRQQAKRMLGSLNKAHLLARRTRNLLLELKDEVTKKPMQRSLYERQKDNDRLPFANSFRLSANYSSRGFGDWANDLLSSFTGEKDQLSKFQEDQAECRKACLREIKEIHRLCALVRDLSDKLELHGRYLQRFHEQYPSVRNKLFPRKSAWDCLRRMFGYRSRSAVCNNQELMDWLDSRIGAKGDLQELVMDYRRLDCLPVVGR